ncbi:hypothetical protein GCM10027347_41830 [Larkinella harenae]
MKAARVLLFLWALSLGACRQNLVEAQTGSVLVSLSYAERPTGDVYYEVYSESGYRQVPPLLTGTLTAANSYQAVFTDLNPGNYVMVINGNPFSLQVTAGRQREYKFP